MGVGQWCRDGAGPGLGPLGGGRTRLFAAAACSVALVDEEGETLRFVASDGAGAEAIVGVTIPVSRGIAGWAAMSGQPIAVRDVQTDARFARDVAESTNYVPSSILAAPMMTTEGEVMGVTSVLDPSVEEASDWTLAGARHAGQPDGAAARRRPRAVHAVTHGGPGPRRAPRRRGMAVRPTGSRGAVGNAGPREPGEHRTGLVGRVRPGGHPRGRRRCRSRRCASGRSAGARAPECGWQ